MQIYMKNITKKWRQSGAILAFTALLLPMIIVGTGLAVDLGNIYVQYSRLQNAADAAAVAGIHGYVANNEKPDTDNNTGGHPHADEMAKKYIRGDYHNLGEKEYIKEQFRALNQNETIYYCVKLTKEVPLYFLSHFYKDYFPVSAIGAASTAAKSDSPLNYLFVFSKHFDVVNLVENENTYNPLALGNSNNKHEGDILTTVDGPVIYTNENLTKKDKKYSEQYPDYFDYFFTKAAKEYKNGKHTVQELVNEAQKVSGFRNPMYYEAYDYREFIKTVDKITENSSCKIDDQNKNNLYLSDENIFNNKSNTIRITSNVGDVTIYLDCSLDKSEGPIYIFLEPRNWGRTISIETRGMKDIDNVRPLIICADGDDQHLTSVKFNLNNNNRNNTFRGVIYTPYTSNEGVLINAENCSFEGTIVGGSMTLRGKNATYKYADYSGGSGKTGTGSSGIKASIVSPPAGIKWD